MIFEGLKGGLGYEKGLEGLGKKWNEEERMRSGCGFLEVEKKSSLSGVLEISLRLLFWLIFCLF
ncbi:unnamed protein product [Moneuplotes crassus]|uniref:Uncharacterized protein n=1 Tax=Euplotes crassus TaxID=5936 RepID=A0AAD1Y4K0_EUPCR|nr:unnamed protein product [Moneuplotes crassus]